MKTCTKCHKSYPAATEYFYQDKRANSGLQCWCRKCQIKATRKWQKQHPNKVKKTVVEYNRKCYKTIKGHLRRVYNNINKRCDNPKDKAYKNYGGRGIKNRFKGLDDFRDYVVNVLGYNAFDKVKGLQIDRIDNNGNYEPGNIRFVTRSENLKNRRQDNANKRTGRKHTE